MTDTAMFAPLTPDEIIAAGPAPTGTGPQDDFIPAPPPGPHPLPADHPTFTHKTLGQPAAVWIYRAADGTPEGYVCRFDTRSEEGGRSKTFLPRRYGTRPGQDGTPRTAWHWKGWGAERPLYRLPDLLADPDRLVIVCEGEKAADAAAGLLQTAVAVSAMNGAKSPAKTDWAPLAGRAVVIWPDQDEPGRAYAASVARLARAAGAASVAVVAVPEDFPAGWDLADQAPAGWDADRLRRLLTEAKGVAPDFTPPPPAPEGDGRLSQRQKLLSVIDRASFWKDLDGEAHASIPVNGHTEHHRVRSQAFREWLDHTAGRDFPEMINGKSRPGSFGKNAIEDALCRCETEARHSGREFEARMRVAEHQGRVYLDLGTPDWSVAEIDAEGWRIIPSAPVPVLRSRRARPLPTPIRGGSVEDLRPLLNVHDESAFRLVVLFLLATLRPEGPFPILALSGEQGTGKSSFSRALRWLVDPVGDCVMQPPADDRDLITAAKGNHVLAFDNLSSLPGDLADSMCRLSTGGDIGGRRLYTDNESAAFAAKRPIILNGIPDLATRGDLASRAIFIRLAPITRRRTEAEIRTDFEQVGGRVLGALLDVLAASLPRIATTRLPDEAADVRLADFAVLAMAAEPALGWAAGSALMTLRTNAAEATAMLIEMDPLAATIRALIDRYGPIDELATELHHRLNGEVSDDVRRDRQWPRSAAQFGTHLRRIAPALRKIGLEVVVHRTKVGQRIRIGCDSAGVGKASPLLNFLGEEERGEAEKGPEGLKTGGRHEEKLSAKTLTPPTPAPESGGNPQNSGVGEVYAGVGTAYTAYTLDDAEENTPGVSGVGKSAKDFTDAPSEPWTGRF